MEQRVDTNFANALYFTEELKKRSDKFELLFEPECTQVCFLYAATTPTVINAL